MFDRIDNFSPDQKLVAEYFRTLPDKVRDVLTRVIGCDGALLGYNTDFAHQEHGMRNWLDFLGHKNTFSEDVIRRISVIRGVPLNEDFFETWRQRFLVGNQDLRDLWRGLEPDPRSDPLEKVMLNASGGWNRFIVNSSHPERVQILTNTLTARNHEFAISGCDGISELSEAVKIKLMDVLARYRIDLSVPLC